MGANSRFEDTGDQFDLKQPKANLCLFGGRRFVSSAH